MLESLRDAQRQLEALFEQRERRNPELYRDLALYLQVLRDGLLNAVQQACFHLATEVHADRYLAMEAGQRRQLHRRLRSLVRRACSLLTVEQLVQLAGQMARERLAQHHQQRQQWLDGLAGEMVEGPAEPPPPPPGSVELALQPPIDLVVGDSPLMARLLPAGQASDQLLALQAAAFPISAVVEAIDPKAEADAVAAGSPTPPPWDQGRLPREPGALLLWSDGVEAALGRRLRNLSHAINVELLRLGLSRSLLPLSLLEAASQGRLELQEAPPNMVRLPVAGIESLAVLLRVPDLEQQLPPLRTCRSRWRQHRQEIRRMAELSRHLRRRIQVLEAEQLWLQDIASQPPQT
jgi:hypothetical protein